MLGCVELFRKKGVTIVEIVGGLKCEKVVDDQHSGHVIWSHTGGGLAGVAVVGRTSRYQSATTAGERPRCDAVNHWHFRLNYLNSPPLESVL